MIPKIIHYIWLGGNSLPKIAEKCIVSWKKYCPDYEIKRWDEGNLDIEKFKFAKDAYNAKKFAFASDVLRTDILFNEGGIYLDIDVELLKPIDDMLNQEKNIGGFEKSNLLAPGLIWAVEKNDIHLSNILKIYSNLDFNIDACKEQTVCKIFTDYFVKLGLETVDKTQEVDNYKFYSSEYFSPIDVVTNKKKVTNNTYSIHWYNASWYTKKQKLMKKLKKIANFCTFGIAGKIYAKKKGRLS